MVDAYPLQWPPGWPRTSDYKRKRALFSQKDYRGHQTRTTFHNAAGFMYDELEKLGATNVILSSNLHLRQDGIPYSKQKIIEDPGVAVYFKFNNYDQCIPCDKWDRPEDNIKAVAKTIEALRGIERWGAKEMVNAAFRGFTALPEHTHSDTIKPMYDYFADCKSEEETKKTFRILSRTEHPDKGGDSEVFNEIMRQFKIKMESFKNGKG